MGEGGSVDMWLARLVAKAEARWGWVDRSIRRGLGSGVVLGALAVGIPGGVVVLAVVVFIVGLLVGGLGGGGVVEIVVELSSSSRVVKEEIMALSLSSLSSRAVALWSEVGVCFGGFVGGSGKEEILAWREAEVRGWTSSWFLWSLLSRAVALWSEVGVCFGGFVGASVGANKVKKGQNDLKERGSHVGFGSRVGFVDVEMGSYLVVVVVGITLVVVLKLQKLLVKQFLHLELNQVYST